MNIGPDIFNLERFLEAQNPVYADIKAELLSGQKRTHWMWFIFPQICGLGRSEIAKFYAIQSLDEAKAYLEHPLLSNRLKECTQIVNELEDCTALSIFGSVDSAKFGSCMTLFEKCAGANSVFSIALEKYFGGVRDQVTLSILRGDGAHH